MPIYVYRCSKCQRSDIEELHRRTDEPPPEHGDGCPNPDGPCPLERVPTAATPKFVGFGWGGWELSADGKSHVRTVRGKAVDNYGD